MGLWGKVGVVVRRVRVRIDRGFESFFKVSVIRLILMNFCRIFEDVI